MSSTNEESALDTPAWKSSRRDNGRKEPKASTPKSGPQPERLSDSLSSGGHVSFSKSHDQMSLHMARPPLAPSVQFRQLAKVLVPGPVPTLPQAQPAERMPPPTSESVSANFHGSDHFSPSSSISSTPLSATPAIPPDRRGNSTKALTFYSGFRDALNFKTLVNMSYSAGSCKLSIHADWPLAEFCSRELPDYEGLESDIPLVLTLTQIMGVGTAGGFTQAASCEEYTHMVWGSRGSRILRAILPGVRQGLCHFEEGTLSLDMVQDKSSEARIDRAMITLSGDLHDVADVLEQLAWLACVFRPSSSQSPICESSVRLSLDSVKGHQLLLQELTPFPDPLYPVTPCWTLAIPTAVIATGFPIRQRNEGRGVEISFDLMASLLRVSAVSEIQGRQALVGPSNVVVPSGPLLEDGDAVQWHCVSSKKLITSNTDNIFEGSMAVDKPVAELAKLRCFLGYFERATVHLGTDETRNQVIGETNLPRSNQRLELAREMTFTTGFSIPGIINGTVGGKVLLQKSLQVAFSDKKEHHDLLADSKMQSVVLYDTNTRTGWLVSELSIVLHLVLLFLNLPATRPRYQDRIPDLQYLPGSRDGGQAAMDFIYQHGDLPLWRKASTTEYKLLQDVVDDFLRSVRALGNASLLQQKPKRLFLKLAGLRGWEFTDILRKKSLIDEKRLPSGHVPSWWRLCDEGTVYTIFATGLGQVIRPTSRVPPGWQTVLEGADLLVASTSCIRQLREHARTCADPNKGYSITRNLLWDPQCERYRDCDRSCEQFIQYLRPIRNSDRYSIPSLAVRSLDAIIFGDHQQFHEVVRQLEQGMRHLDRLLTSQFSPVVQMIDGVTRQGAADEHSKETSNTVS
ncbi:hypothetical protein GE09DRAFT_1120954 [Coniochaeta sp. 2T2.1]|nr:hypothetical protein GE09DRAFT_1120954 [Coniochaeta sp. 2T2.1]